MVFGFRVPFIGGGIVNGLWLGCIGWFLHGAAVMSYQKLLLREA